MHYLQNVATTAFPAFTGLEINMMPFVIGDDTSLPPECRPYAAALAACGSEQAGKVGYLTIHESVVAPGTSQRRGGVHTESPGVLPAAAYENITLLHPAPVAWGWGSGRFVPEDDQVVAWGTPPWGGGFKMNGSREGGIYMASNVSGSTRAWDMAMEPSEIGLMGDCSESFLRKQVSLAKQVPEERFSAGEIWWMTDRTPHESMPVEVGVKRQFFRLVSNQVGIWFAQHSTPNPLGVAPDCPVTDANKFDVMAAQQLSA